MTDGRLLGLSVLLVDDHFDSLEALRLILQAEGAVVATAETVREAMAFYEGHRWDAIVSDLNLPARDGFALAAGVRSAEKDGQRQTSLICYTAVPVDERRSILARGFDVVLAKPNIEALVTVLSHWPRAPTPG